ncbi:MAG TPA: hypothetical protein EYN80_05795, partial [Alphaproteobacteria bacterium]|nr:hypothetical protein [Alphaproteobacteria bacterium]
MRAVNVGLTLTASLLGLIFSIVIGVNKNQGNDRGGSAAGAPDEGKIGVEVIRASVSTLPGQPGVYRMLDPSGKALYVGKA